MIFLVVLCMSSQLTKYFCALKIFKMASYKSLLILPAILCLISACVNNTPIEQTQYQKYDADKLAKDWREQVRKNPNNPYEGLSSDNDADYYAPKKNIAKNIKPVHKQPAMNSL